MALLTDIEKARLAVLRAQPVKTEPEKVELANLEAKEAQ